VWNPTELIHVSAEAFMPKGVTEQAHQSIGGAATYRRLAKLTPWVPVIGRANRKNGRNVTV
jgi:hypothetical protein